MVRPVVPTKYTWDGIQSSNVRCKPCQICGWQPPIHESLYQPAKDGGRTQAHNTVGAIGYAYQPPTRNVTETSNTPTPGGGGTHAFPWPPHCRQAKLETKRIMIVEAEARDNQVIVMAM